LPKKITKLTNFWKKTEKGVGEEQRGGEKRMKTKHKLPKSGMKKRHNSNHIGIKWIIGESCKSLKAHK
jgi:hypothetical protein